jgi:hypothetical protein
VDQLSEDAAEGGGGGSGGQAAERADWYFGWRVQAGVLEVPGVEEPLFCKTGPDIPVLGVAGADRGRFY